MQGGPRGVVAVVGVGGGDFGGDCGGTGVVVVVGGGGGVVADTAAVVVVVDVGVGSVVDDDAKRTPRVE